MRLAWVFVVLACSSKRDDPRVAPAITCDDVSIPIASVCAKVGPERDALTAPACARGTYALPGESCHPVGTCLDPEGSLYVDAAARPGGDGSAARPFQKIGDAIAVAATEATIAIRPGKYEGFAIRKPLSLRGACADKVAIEGTVEVRATASVRGVAITGPDVGVLVRDGVAELDEIWVHDTGRMGVSVDTSTKTTASVHVTRSLIEAANLGGVAAFGAAATIESSVVRDTRILGGQGGPGILAQYFNNAPAVVVVRGSLVERAHEAGIGIAGGSLDVIDTLVRDVDAMADGTAGNGILASYDKASGVNATLHVAGTTITATHEIGIALNRGEATIENTIVTNVLPTVKEKKYGVGIQAEPGCILNVKSSLIADASHIGIGYFGATGRIESTIVRNTGKTGIGVADADGARSVVEIMRSIIRTNTVGGVIVAASDLTIAETLIAGTRASDGRFGDGLVAIPSDLGAPSIAATSVVVRDNARAGFAMFGGTLKLRDSQLACNGFDLDVEDSAAPVSLSDDGGNACGCSSLGVCRGTRNSLELTPAPAHR